MKSLPILSSTWGSSSSSTAVQFPDLHKVSLDDSSWGLLGTVGEVHFEITVTCNLSCDYCYAEVAKPEQRGDLYPMEVYRRAIEILARHSRRPHLEIIFHGGEPLLENASWYEEACEFTQSTFDNHDKTCEFGLQSNLTLLQQEHVDVFVKYGVKVGTSLDGPKEIHDAIRGRFDKTVNNLARLREAGVFSGAIAVLHHHNWEQVPDIYDTFHSLGIGAFHLNVASAVGHGVGMIPLTEDQIFRVLCDNFTSLQQHEGAIVETRLLEKLRRHTAPPQTADFLTQLRCDNPFCHAGINMVIFRADGEIYPCGCAGTSGNLQNYLLGNITSPQLCKADYLDRLKEFHRKTDKYENECRSCPARFVCEHGCPAFDINDPVTPEHHCGATKRFEQYLRTIPSGELQRIASFTPPVTTTTP